MNMEKFKFKGFEKSLEKMGVKKFNNPLDKMGVKTTGVTLSKMGVKTSANPLSKMGVNLKGFELPKSFKDKTSFNAEAPYFKIGDLVWYEGKKAVIADVDKNTYALWGDTGKKELEIDGKKDVWVHERDISRRKE